MERGLQVLGSLSATVILHPSLEAADPTIADAFSSFSLFLSRSLSLALCAYIHILISV